MRVEKQVDEGLKHRDDLIRIMDAAAEFLASRDTDADTQAVARWRLWVGPTGEPVIGLGLQDEGYSKGQQFAPSQLVPADIRELRLIRLWNDVLMARTHREVAKANKLLNEYGGEPDDEDGGTD